MLLQREGPFGVRPVNYCEKAEWTALVGQGGALVMDTVEKGLHGYAPSSSPGQPKQRTSFMQPALDSNASDFRVETQLFVEPSIVTCTEDSAEDALDDAKPLETSSGSCVPRKRAAKKPTVATNDTNRRKRQAKSLHSSNPRSINEASGSEPCKSKEEFKTESKPSFDTTRFIQLDG